MSDVLERRPVAERIVEFTGAIQDAREAHATELSTATAERLRSAESAYRDFLTGLDGLG